MNRTLLKNPISYLTVVLTLVSLLSFAGAGISSAKSDPTTPSLSPAVDPTPLYSITWTATGTATSDVTDAYGQRTVTNRQVAMAGSGIWRAYAAGSWDYSPYNLTVTDDYDEVITTPCGGQGGSDRIHNTITLTDPTRYSGGPRHDFPLILAPLQRADGSWYISDPLSGFYVNRFF